MNIYAARRSVDNLENGDKPFDCTASLHSVSPGTERRERQQHLGNKFNDDNESGLQISQTADMNARKIDRACINALVFSALISSRAPT